MSANTIDAQLLAKMVLSGAKNLESNKDYINELNVFPVPDGDTGTNMTLTIMSAAKDIVDLQTNAANDSAVVLDMKTLCKSMSSGSLRGARGNSGVILSQLLRGFTKVVRDYDELDLATISAGCDKAVETAYKAVMKPKEGTILTVAKGISEKANQLFEEGCDNFETFFKEVLAYGKEVLDSTPDMLPVLKEAGVVDSGGQGLMDFLQGAYDAYLGKEVDFTMDQETKEVAGEVRKLTTEQQAPVVKFGYELSLTVHFFRTFNVQREADFRKYLESIGDKLEITVEPEYANLSIVTNDPGMIIQKGILFGELTDITVNNVRYQASKGLAPTNETVKEDTLDALFNGNAAETLNLDALNNGPVMTVQSERQEAEKIPEERKPVGFISVAVGDGIAEIFKNLGVDQLIEGGQTMNPSTEDVLTAIEKTNADTIYVLPNNKNIIMAANQARDLTEDKKIVVIPTKTVPQGISSLISFDPNANEENNVANMQDSIANVKTGQVTYAVRDTVIEGVEIHQNDFMGIGDSGILSNGKDLEAVVLEMVDKMMTADAELISIYYGSDVAEEDAKKICEQITAKYGNCDVEFQYGGQPIYYYIISVE